MLFLTVGSEQSSIAYTNMLSCHPILSFFPLFFPDFYFSVTIACSYAFYEIERLHVFMNKLFK